MRREAQANIRVAVMRISFESPSDWDDARRIVETLIKTIVANVVTRLGLV